MEPLSPERRRLCLQPGAEPVPGYRLLQPLGEGGVGEVWKCQGPDGRLRAFKAVRDRSHGLANDGPDVGREMQAVRCVRRLRHEFLLAVEHAEIVAGALLLVMELADESLADQLNHCRSAGLAGVPRPTLLARLAEAADILDLMNQDHGLAHLDVKPHNLLLVGGHVRLADFGLVSRLSPPIGPEEEAAPACRPGVVSPLYASPEAFRGRPSSASDQYSLAVCFHELLTGALPFEGKTARQVVMQHAQAEPDLRRLVEPDRAAVARALAKDPERRFSCCTDFILALLGGEDAGAAPAPLSAALRGPASGRVGRRRPREVPAEAGSVLED